MREVRLSTTSWAASVSLAESFFERFTGIRHKHVSQGVMLPGTMFHTMGLSRPLEMVAIDRGGRVIETRTVQRNRFVAFPGASHVVELPGGSRLPHEGELLEVHRV